MQLGPSDEELMLAYQLGDSLAFNTLYSRHSGRVYGYLKAKTQNEAMARDVFQATFLKLHNARSRYNSEFPFVPWLFTICRSELIDAMRKKQRIQEEGCEELPETFSLKSEPEFDVAGAVGQLPEKQREALDLRYTQEFSFEQIALRLNTSPVNARKIVSRALKVLKGKHGK
jgi:RNA polymerase sigma factor (sigma-70 family)